MRTRGALALGEMLKENKGLYRLNLSRKNYFLYLFNYLRAVVRENRGFFLKFGKYDHTDFDETLHIRSTLRVNNFPEIIDFLAKRLLW